MAFATVNTAVNAEGAFDSTIRKQINTNFGVCDTNFAKCPEIVAAPAAADSAGKAGQIAFGDGVLYICIATNTWQKVTIATWT